MQFLQWEALKGLITLQVLQILYLLKYPNWLIYIVFLDFDFLIWIADLSFLGIIPGSERPLKSIKIVVRMNKIIINIIKKLLIFVIKNYTIKLILKYYIIFLITFPIKDKKTKTGIKNAEKVAINAFIDIGPVITLFPNKK